MSILIIDTATCRSCIALITETSLQKVILLSEDLQSADTNAELVPAIKKLFQEEKLTLASLRYVIVGRGPGSYTGIRVGAAVAKAITFALQIPLVGISSLRAFVPNLDTRGRFLAAIDAKVGGVYCIEGIIEEGEMPQVDFLGQEQLLSLDDFILRFPQNDYLVTPSWAPLAARLKEMPVHKLPKIIEREPSMAMLAELGHRAFSQREYSLNGDLALLYLRKTQAEIETNLPENKKAS
jgi:tRNA threonylcarbamoyladenosine biosynthesis protein TsaB